MTEDTGLAFTFPAIEPRMIIAVFDGGRLSSDGGVMLLAAAARWMGIAGKLAAAPNSFASLRFARASTSSASACAR
jgi:hypothetical protein